jgi:hypothetical protein
MRHNRVITRVQGFGNYVGLPQLPGERPELPSKSYDAHSTPLAVTQSLLQGESSIQSTPQPRAG